MILSPEEYLREIVAVPRHLRRKDGDLMLLYERYLVDQVRKSEGVAYQIAHHLRSMASRLPPESILYEPDVHRVIQSLPGMEESLRVGGRYWSRSSRRRMAIECFRSWVSSGAFEQDVGGAV